MIIIINSYFFTSSMLTPLFGVQESFSERVVFDLQSCYLPREKKQTKNKQLKSKYIKKNAFG